MHYPLEKIKALHDEVKGYSVTALSTKLSAELPELTKDIHYQTDSLENDCEVDEHELSGIDETVLHIAVNNLAAFLLTGDAGEVTRAVFNWADHMGDENHRRFLQGIGEWIKDDSHQSVTNLVYLAYYEAEIRKHRKMSTGNTVLPGEKACKEIKKLADTLMTVMGQPKLLTSRVSDDAGYSNAVNKGNIDFLVGDTLYITRLGGVQPRDSYTLLICHALIKASPKYNAETINHVCLVNLLNGVSLRLGITQVDPSVLETIHACIYGPKIIAATPIVETPGLWRRAVNFIKHIFVR